MQSLHQATVTCASFRRCSRSERKTMQCFEEYTELISAKVIFKRGSGNAYTNICTVSEIYSSMSTVLLLKIRHENNNIA